MSWEAASQSMRAAVEGKKPNVMISKETLYLTADREKVVKEGDPKAQFLLVRAGMEISDADAEKYGVKAGKPASEAPADANSGPKPQNREDSLPHLRHREQAPKSKKR